MNVGFSKVFNQGIEIFKVENILDSDFYSNESIESVGDITNSCSYY